MYLFKESTVQAAGEEVTVEMLAGDVLIFHDLLLHASHPNTSGRSRFSLIPTYRSTLYILYSLSKMKIYPNLSQTLTRTLTLTLIVGM